MLPEWSPKGRGKLLLSSVAPALVSLLSAWSSVAPALVSLFSALTNSDRCLEDYPSMSLAQWTEVSSYGWQIACSYFTAPAIERRQKAEGELRGPLRAWNRESGCTRIGQVLRLGHQFLMHR